MSQGTASRGAPGKPLAHGAVRTAQQRARADHFVGRERQLRDFENLLVAGETPRIVFVHGPGGIGKSSLLDGFEVIAEHRGHPFVRLDARLLPAAPDAIAQAAYRAIAAPATDPDDAVVLALDHAERLTALDTWLRTELIPGLPSNVVLVLAGREPPGPQWRADPGLHSLLVDYELRPLEGTAVAEYLERRRVPASQRQAVAGFARGHPLALALAADQALRQPEGAFDAAGHPDLIRALVEWLLRDIDDPRHREAIAACATVRRLDEPLLAAMLGRDDARAEYDWLAAQHFVTQQPGGLVIHDLVREIVVHDLRGRDLRRHHDLIRRAAGRLLDGLESAGQYAALQAVGDAIHALRHEPYVRRQFPFGDVDCYPDTAQTEEYPALAAQVAKLEGEESAAWFEYWLRREGTELMVMRDSARAPVALAMLLRFGAGDIARGHDDPCVRALFRHLSHHAPLRGNEQAMLGRFLLAHGSHQARTPVWAQLVAQLNGLMFTPGISLLGWVSDMAYDWGGIEEHADARQLPGSGYSIGGHDYMITGHDCRREPPAEWARNCVERILRAGAAPELQPAEIVLLDKPEFTDAVAQALNSFHDDAMLAKNPLLRSPMLRRHSTRRDVESLRALLRETSAERLTDRRRQCTLHEVLEHSYFRSTVKQQAAAEALFMSERTLRRRLQEARARLIEALWELDTTP